MIIPENYFTLLSVEDQDKLAAFMPSVSIDIELDYKELERAHHVACKTFMSYEGRDV